MKTQDYLQIVIENLRAAAQARKQEIDNLYHSLSQYDQDHKNHMRTMKQQEAESLHNAAATDEDRDRASKLREAQEYRMEESREKSDFEQFKRDVDRQLSIKRRNLDDINRVLQTIEQGWLSI